MTLFTLLNRLGMLVAVQNGIDTVELTSTKHSITRNSAADWLDIFKLLTNASGDLEWGSGISTLTINGKEKTLGQKIYPTLFNALNLIIVMPAQIISKQSTYFPWSTMHIWFEFLKGKKNIGYSTKDISVPLLYVMSFNLFILLSICNICRVYCIILFIYSKHFYIHFSNSS